jgi:hypothetical protein
LPRQKVEKQSNIKILVCLFPTKLTLANAVARIDQLEFLSDIIPRTMSYKKAVARKEQILTTPDSPEQNGSPAVERKKSRVSGGRDSSGRGEIEKFFGRKGGNGVVEDDSAAEEDKMDIDG